MSPERRFHLNDGKSDSGDSGDEAQINSDEDGTRPWQDNLPEIISYPSGEGISDDEAEAKADAESVAEPQHVDNVPSWADGLNRNDNVDGENKDGVDEQEGDQEVEEGTVIQYRPRPKPRQLTRTTVKIYSNKRLHPARDFKDPDHVCANNCWKYFSKEEVMGLRQRWWFQGLASKDEFKNELLTNRTTTGRPKFQMLGKVLCARCTFWVLCINASQLYDGKSKLNRPISSKNHRHEIARAWY